MKLTELANEIRIRNNNLAKVIEQNIDQETGEIPEEAFEFLEKAEEKRVELLTGVFEGLQGYKTLADAVKSKMDRLKSLENYYRNTEKSLHKMIMKLVPEGESINTEDYAITWRKSSYVEVDSFAELSKIEKEYPLAVKTEKTFIKTELSKLLKAGKKIEGIKIKTKLNLQIK